MLKQKDEKPINSVRTKSQIKRAASALPLTALVAFSCPIPVATAGNFASGVTDNLANSLRNAYMTVMGTDSATAYSNLVCGGLTVNTTNCQGAPQAGIVGTLAPIATAVVQSLSCVQDPTSGTASVTISAAAAAAAKAASVVSSAQPLGTAAGTVYTLTYGVPTHKVPSGWVNGGTTFQNRFTFSTGIVLSGTVSTPMSFALEYNCGSNPQGYVAVSMPMLGSAGGAQMPGYSYNREIAVYVGPVDTAAITTGTEVYYAEHVRNIPNSTRGANVMRIHYNNNTGAQQIWGVLSMNPQAGGGNIIARVMLNGTLNSNASVLVDGIFDVGTNGTGAFTSTTTGVSTQTVPTASQSAFHTAFSGLTNNTPVQYQGCMRFSSDAAGVKTAPSSSALCSGSPLSPPSFAPALSSTGLFNLQWVTSVMPDLLEQLGAAGPIS